MEFYDVIRSRRSVRGYKPDAIPAAALERIQEAVRCAPSACNRQPYRFLLVSNPALREAIYQCYPSSWIKEAPLVVVACGNAEAGWHRLDGQPAVDLDLGIALEHLVLAAAAEGLGSCWVCAFEVEKLTAVLQLEAPWRALAITPLGYPAAEPRKWERKEMNELFQVVK